MLIDGEVIKIVYRNDLNAYTVMQVNSDGELITCVGTALTVKEHDYVELEGELVFHEKYGEQINFTRLSFKERDTIESIRSYLIKSGIPKVGEKRAEEIIDLFGLDSIKVIFNETDKLLQVRGIGKKALADIKEYIKSNKEREEILQKLAKYNLPTATLLKIYNIYGDEAINILKNNPYRLIYDKIGIGFKTADKIALEEGADANGLERLKAAIIYLLNIYLAQGSTYIPKDRLYEELKFLMTMDEDKFNLAIKELATTGNIAVKKERGTKYNVYLSLYYEKELECAKRLYDIKNASPSTYVFDCDKLIEKYEASENIIFDEKQKLAIKKAFVNNISIITGGPGTGKTSIIEAIITILKTFNISFALAAPTGKAAKRMEEKTGEAAMTLHRLLNIAPIDGADFFESSEDIEADFIIVDEVSMMDTLLFSELLAAIEPGKSLLLLGDKDQLPSVGAGNVLEDLINSNEVETTELEHIYRQSENSMIAINSQEIRMGHMPEVNKKDSDFFFISKDSDDDILEEILDLLNERLINYFSLDPFKDVQILTPTKKGKLGTLNLNYMLQNLLNSRADNETVRAMGKEFRVGDKVIQMKNNYDIISHEYKNGKYEEVTGVFNGDTGIIRSIDKDNETIDIDFDDGKSATYDFSLLGELSLSYALTVHKSQGSEFDCVIMPITYANEKLLTRNLLYTAITRAKKLLILVGREKYLKLMIDNNFISTRYTSLEKRIRDLKKVFK